MTEVTPYLEGKWRSFFGFLDNDGDKLLTFNDFECLARRFAETSTLRKDRVQKFRLMWLKWWWLFEKLLGDTYIDITEDLFIEAIRRLVVDENSAMRDELVLIWEAMFDALDENGDGGVSLEELAMFYKLHGIENELHVLSVFQALNVDENECISSEEFIDAIKLFWFGDDPNNDYSFVFGPPRMNPKPMRRQRKVTPKAQIRKWCCFS